MPEDMLFEERLEHLTERLDHYKERIEALEDQDERLEDQKNASHSRWLEWLVIALVFAEALIELLLYLRH